MDFSSSEWLPAHLDMHVKPRLHRVMVMQQGSVGGEQTELIASLVRAYYLRIHNVFSLIFGVKVFFVFFLVRK